MLRNSKFIRIGGDGEGGKDVVVYELSVAQIGDLVTVLGSIPREYREIDPVALAQMVFGGGDGPARRLLLGATDMAEAIDDCGGLALLDIADAWIEVNQPFFDRIGRAAEKLATPAETSPAGYPFVPPKGAVKQQAA